MVLFEARNIKPEGLSEKTRATFGSSAAPSWCSKFLRDPTLCPIATPSRQPKASSEDSFIAETLATTTTIVAWQSFYRTLQSSSEPLETETLKTAHDSAAVGGELVCLLALGRGMNGHTNVAHGGFIATILDETMGMVVSLHQSAGMSGYTAFIKVEFKKPVPTPGAIVCRTWLERRSAGRKLWLRGTVEDGEGGLFAEAESLWIEVKRKVQRL